jgi:uncharacterized membrane protein YebE (DUF533 family)
MNPEFLINGVLGSVLGGGRKKNKRALKYLTKGSGSLGRSLLSNPTTLLTAAGLAWGVYETMTNKGNDGTQWGGGNAPAGGGGQWGGTGGAAGQWTGGTAMSQGGQPGAPPSAVPLPPLPDLGGGAAPAGIDDEALRMVRLAVSAANADGAMNEQERAAVLQQAQAAGVGEVVGLELQQRRPLAEIVAGVSDPSQRATLYVLAFTVLRADEQLTGAERIYLAQLAHLLGLDPATVQRLEQDTGERIDALGDQGQLGG